MLNTALSQSRRSRPGFVGQILQPQLSYTVIQRSMEETWKQEIFSQFENKELCQVSVETFLGFLFRCHFLLDFGNCSLLGLLVLVIRRSTQPPKQIQTSTTRVGRGSGLCCQSCLHGWTDSLVCCNFCTPFERRTCHFLFLTGVLDGMEDFVDHLGLVGGILHACETEEGVESISMRPAQRHYRYIYPFGDLEQ